MLAMMSTPCVDIDYPTRVSYSPGSILGVMVNSEAGHLLVSSNNGIPCILKRWFTYLSSKSRLHYGLDLHPQLCPGEFRTFKENRLPRRHVQ
jgi:hypothetical protein